MPDPQPVHSVCGAAILRSRYDYAGRSGAYNSGTAGLPTYGTPSSDFPRDTAGVVLPAGNRSYFSYQLQPQTVYYLLPGTHTGFLMADTGDTFVGGFADGTATVLSGDYRAGYNWAIDSNPTSGDQPDVTIEYLTIEKYLPNDDSGAVNPDSNTGWVIKDNMITLNVPGAGVILGADGTLVSNCLTLNGQYGFQSEDTDSWGQDALTGGPYDLLVDGNEISYNDTCDFEGLITNSAVHWSNHNPVPPDNRNSRCGPVTNNGDYGGFKLWRTDGVTIAGNYIHGNYGPGIWADTDNANTTMSGNTIADNDGEAIIEEISYNFSIVANYLADNGWATGLSNPGFPTPAIYISESGSDGAFGGVPACSEPSCAGQKSYASASDISSNVLVDNGGGVFLWQNSDRYCSDGGDGVCTLVGHQPGGPFTQRACAANLPSAAVSTTTYQGVSTGSPREDWWDGCLWRTENVRVTRNAIHFNPARVPHCNTVAWPDCGANGIFSEYGSPPGNKPGWIIPTQLAFFQGDSWSDNAYYGPSTFYAWNQGNNDDPVSWSQWTGRQPAGGTCNSAYDRQSGSCAGPFGQDAGSTYDPRPS